MGKLVKSLLERCDRLHGALAVHPLAIVGIHIEHFGRDRRHLPTFPIAERGLELQIRGLEHFSLRCSEPSHAGRTEGTVNHGETE